MTPRRKKILIGIGVGIPALLLILVITSILIIRTAWFANYVREKIIATTEESTGGVVEIGSFQFDWMHLTARIRNFVLHGNEPKGSDPLARIALLELRLKLFSGLYHMVDLQYLGITQPQVNLIVFPDGTTNIPQPKVQKQPSQTSGLETVVDLAVGQFQIQSGLLEYSQSKTPFNARGENLRALLNYNTLNPSYSGNLSIDPLWLTSANSPRLGVRVNIPVTLEKDAVRIANARLNTDQSQIVLNGSVQNMNAPQISAQVNATVSLPEMQRSFDLPIDPNAKGAPNVLTAELAANMDQKNNRIQIQTAHVGLGQTTLQASGTLAPGSTSGADFNANLALGELASLLKVSGVQASGVLQANGKATVDPHNNYAADGTINSKGISLRSGTTRLSDVSFYSPFHADPYLISLDGLKLNAFGGSLSAKIFVENLEKLSVEGTLRNFSLPVLAQSFTGKRLGYDGTIDGSLKAAGDLKAKGTTGYTANANLAIVPGHRGVPISGRLVADYRGANDTLGLDHSYLTMPNSRIDLSGTLNRQIDINLVSHNLNDFLPAANFGAAKPQSSLPITLQGGGAANLQAEITGNLAAPHLTSHAALDHFAVEQRSFDHFGLDLAASPSGAVVQNGVLTRKALQTNFDASIGLHKWSPTPRSPLSANLTMRNGDIADLLNLAGEDIPATGNLSADVHINGTYGDPLGSATLQVVNGSAYQQPFDHLSANVALSDQLITLSSLELAAAGGRVDVSGTFQHPRDSFTVGHAQFHVASSNVQLANIRPLQQQSPGVAGAIQLAADAAADVQQTKKGDVVTNTVTVSNISADLSARGLRVQNQSAGDLTATARTNNGTVNYNLSSNFAGSNIQLNGRSALAAPYTTTADASIQNLSVEKSLQIAGQGAIPARGTFSANAHVAGTLNTPNANLSFALQRANVYQEPINALRGQVQYNNTLINIPAIELDVPAGTMTLSGSFSHPAHDMNAGALTLNLKSSDIQVAKIEHVEQAQPGVTGTLRLAADLSANVRNQNGNRTVLISTLNADASANQLEMNKRRLGGAAFTARTAGQNVNFRLDSDVAGSQIHGSGQSQLRGDYPVRANLTFANIRYANIAPFISPDPSVKPSFDALVDGQASVDGPILNPDNLNANLQLNRLEARTVPQASPTGAPPGKAVVIHNDGPIVVALNHSVVQVKALRIVGPGTNIDGTGSVNFKNQHSPLALTLDANADLGVLQDADRDFYSSGAVAMNATIHGSFAEPRVNGRIELKNANINYAEAPNGLSNGNGVILLNGTNASIQNLTGETGGGKVTLSGFVGYANSNVNFNLRAAANKVRVRYSGISVTSNANISLTGNTNRSLVSGTVTVQRIAYGSSGDAGSLLSTASTPPTTPSAPSPILANMRLDAHILTSPDLRVVTTYANKLAVAADLQLRGTAAEPGMLGRVTVTDGQLVFFGNTYTVNTGTINFYDPTSIQPVLNISLETIAQNVDVTLGVSGPINNLQLHYTSDPPLTFQQIVKLLATNTTPSDPTIAAQQPTPPQQSNMQMGESAILGQAVANPLASRVQRVFGLSQFQIDPNFAGSGGQPGARVTLQQKIANNITFTYITDVTQTNSEIIRVEWAFTPAMSAVALRDFNGNVSLELYYRFKKR